MDVIQALHMNAGEGETSYAKNSVLQRKVISFGKQVIGEAIADVVKNHYPECMGISDLGCSSGSNTLMVMSEIIDKVYNTCSEMGKPMPELRVFLNDLPGNDFNSLFRLLPSFYAKLQEGKGKGFDNCCFVSGVPRSFYGRLFPGKSMHFVHSSSSLHWLSQVPPSLESNASILLNKGKIFISKTSPQSVKDAYHYQFQKDFSLFLKSRSEEMVSGGRMVLSFLGRRSADPTTEESCYPLELLAEALTSMVSTGQVLEEKIDSFNAPYYPPSMEEVKCVVEEEGCFAMNSLKAFEIEWDAGFPKDSTSSRGENVAKTTRAVVQSMFQSHFGKELDMDALFRKHAELVDDYFSRAKPTYTILVMSFTRKGP